MGKHLFVEQTWFKKIKWQWRRTDMIKNKIYFDIKNKRNY